MPSWEPADRIKAKLNRAKFKKESLAVPEAKRDEVPLPEPHGYVGACNQYCIQPKDSPLMWEKLNRWTADQLREYGRQCVQAALPVMPQEVQQAWSRVVAWPVRADGLLARDISTVGEWLRSQNLIKE